MLPDEKLLENFWSKATCPPSSNKRPWYEITRVLDCGFGVFWVHKHLLGETVFIWLNCRGCFKKGRNCSAHCVSNNYYWSLFGNCGSQMTNIVYFMYYSIFHEDTVYLHVEGKWTTTKRMHMKNTDRPAIILWKRCIAPVKWCYFYANLLTMSLYCCTILIKVQEEQHCSRSW